jgi:hypothetical protein
MDVPRSHSVPDGLITGPIFVDGRKIEGTGDTGQALNIYPEAGGVQHCEVAGMRDTLDGFADKLPNGRGSGISSVAKTGRRRSATSTPPGRSIRLRFDLPHVVQCAAGVGPYRPDALVHHEDFKRYYRRTFPMSKLPHPGRRRRAERHRRSVGSNPREPAPLPDGQPSRRESTERSVFTQEKAARRTL